MSEPILSAPLPQGLPAPLKKKRVLLIDDSNAKRELRAEIMRKVGMDVDCAADIPEARVWWRADLYDLVLISAEGEQGRRDKFCQDIRGATPPQQLAFLVGKPEYLANSPNLDVAILGSENDEPVALVETKARVAVQIAATSSQTWGILEACRRISVVRAAADARTRAIRQRPVPQRDSETSRSHKGTSPGVLSELTSEEMQ